jgi:isopenicillin N synthase-like dioxygenase
MIESVPVISIAELDDPTVLARIDRACREWGFFQVTDHGIDASLLADVMDVSGRFFALPRHEKRRISRDAGNPWGYFDRELTKNRRDFKEIYDFGPADGDALVPRWPAGAFRLRFEPVVRACYASCMALSLQILAAIARNLGVHRESFESGFLGTTTSFLRLNHYPRHVPGTGEPDRPFGVGEHTDSGALTILLQDSQPGLEVCRDGRWYLVEPRPDALVVNIGDMIQVWSNDQYRAALHRVITNPSADRYSVPFFLNPSWEATYEPLPGTITRERPARYRRIAWREFRTLRAAGDYADLGEEVQVSRYRL